MRVTAQAWNEDWSLGSQAPTVLLFWFSQSLAELQLVEGVVEVDGDPRDCALLEYKTALRLDVEREARALGRQRLRRRKF